MESLLCLERPPNRCIIGSTVQRHTFDDDYLRRLASGDPETELHFTSYFGDLLTAKLRSRLRSWHLVEDVKQETFLRVLKTIKKDGLAQAQALGGFVNSVCNNILFEVYRAQSRIADSPEDRESEEANAEAAMSDAQQRAAVQAVLSAMPKKDRTILTWVFFEERNKDEICRQLRVNREYLRVLLHRARASFRTEYLKRKGPPEPPAIARGAGG